VRVTYSPNRVAGQWRAHGRYLSRDSATQQGRPDPGFSGTSEQVDVPATLDGWQAAGDERVFKLILSPEFGERLDLVRFTREFMTQAEIDLSRKLEWCAVVHTNTVHPHVHVALRGVSEGQSFRLPRKYVKAGLREAAENLCTAQLGYRTELDAIAAERREVVEQRFTSLDRTLMRNAREADSPSSKGAAGALLVAVADPMRGAAESASARAHHLRARLLHLQTMGLAKRVGDRQWELRRDLGAVLKAMQRAQDRQKLLAVHGSLISDSRLPMVVTPIRRGAPLDGRVLIHGEEDTGRMYLLLEGTDARVHYITHTAEVATAWNKGKLRPNSFVRFRRMFGDDGRPMVVVTDLGDADRLLRNRKHLRDLARDGVSANNQAWGGWLGRLGDALRTVSPEREDDRRPHRSFLGR
jgi:hypothetical protein